VTIIHKTPDEFRVPPNLRDYEHTRAGFDWSDVPELCEGLGVGACNIAYAAVDRHADGPAATRTALRFITDPRTTGELVAHGIAATVSDWLAELGANSPLVEDLARAVGSADWPTAYAIGEHLAVDVSVAA